MSRLTLIKTRSDQDVRVGDKVYMNDVSGIPTTTHGQEGDPIGIVVVHALTVKETCTSAQVLWQDGTSETLTSTELIPYLNPDEYDCWCASFVQSCIHQLTSTPIGPVIMSSIKMKITHGPPSSSL